MSEIPEAKSLRWLCNQFPITIPPQDDGDKICNASMFIVKPEQKRLMNCRRK